MAVNLENRVIEKPSLTLVRRVNAAPEKVYAAWTDPEKIVRWFGPSDTDIVRLVEMDVRVGGRFHIVFGAPGGEEHDVSGTYREVVPGRKLAFTWMWRTMPERESFVTVEIRPVPGGAELTLTHAQFFDVEARDRHQGGWAGALDKLARAIEPLAPVRIENAKAMRIAGLSARYSMQTMSEIPAQWSRFIPHLPALGAKPEDAVYGIISHGREPGFDYLCGVEAPEQADLPDMYVSVRLPEQSYAVYEHHGHVRTLCHTMAAIGEQISAGEPLQILERYGADFDPLTGAGRIEIWVPLQS
jgi:uncharacterized protein YndB with AHSA1/START domain/predicted transcriptional regulator YdeE